MRTTTLVDEFGRPYDLAELEALYTGNRPIAGDERDRALTVAEELRAEIDRCVHAVKANDGALAAGERLRRMRRALHRVTTEEDLAPTLLVGVFRALRQLVRLAPKKYKANATVDVFRKSHGEHLSDWTDKQVLDVLDAPNFNAAMAKALTDHGYTMGPSNIDRLVQGRKSRKKSHRV